MLPPAPHGPLPGKAPIVMFERIAAAHQRLTAAAGPGGSVSGAGEGGSGSGQADGGGSGSKEQPRVALVATAALTNVALLLALYPEVKDMIEVGAAQCSAAQRSVACNVTETQAYRCWACLAVRA